MKKLKVLLYLFFLTLLSLTSYAICTGSVDLDINEIERTPGESTFKIVATANRAGDCLNIAWEPEDINTYLEKDSSEEIVTKSVSGDIEILSQKESFKASVDSSESQKIYLYELGDAGWKPFQCNINNCNDWGYTPTQYSVSDAIGNCYCIYKDASPVATFGSFLGDQSYEGEAKVSFTGLPEENIRFGKEADSLNIQNKVRVEWRGDLMGGNTLTSPTYNVYKDASGKYHLTNEDSGIKGVTFDANGNTGDNIDSCLGESDGWQISSGKEGAQECISTYNNAIQELLTDKISSYIESNKQVTNAYFEGSELIAEAIPYSNRFPQFVFTFDAEWVGVKWVTGIPKVYCPEQVTFVSGDTKTVPVEVENIDNYEKGAFSLNIDCKGISSSLSEDRLSLDSNEKEQVIATLTHSTENDGSFVCNFEAYATKDTSKSSQCQFELTVKSSLIDCPSGCCLKGGSYKELSCDAGYECCTESSGLVGTCKTSCNDVLNQDSNEKNLGNSNQVTGNVVSSKSRSSPTGFFFFFILIVGIGGFVYYKKRNSTQLSENTSASTEGIFCHNCGSPAEKSDKFCIDCGEKL